MAAVTWPGNGNYFRCINFIKVSGKWDFSYQAITSGTVNDTDYAGDNRALKTAEFNLQTDKGFTIKTRLELSYLLWSNQTFSFSPHAGYFWKLPEALYAGW